MKQYQEIIIRELQIRSNQVAAVAALLNDGGTVPFIARYRKEATGLLDETQITAIRDRLAQLAELDKRRQAIIASLNERDLLDERLHRAITEAPSLTILEDLYLPHRPKRRTRSIIAKEKGLEPLALAIFKQDNSPVTPERFINPKKEVANVDEALAGARDIIAEWISEDGAARGGLRNFFARKGLINSRVVKKNQEAGAKFRDYFEWSEPVRSAPGHRVLAMRRGEKEKILRLTISLPEEQVLPILNRNYVANRGGAAAQVELAITTNSVAVSETLAEFRATLKNIDKSFESANAMMIQNQRNIAVTLKNLRATSESMQELILNEFDPPRKFTYLSSVTT